MSGAGLAHDWRTTGANPVRQSVRHSHRAFKALRSGGLAHSGRSITGAAQDWSTGGRIDRGG
ncbi:MAG: hypothetical protein ACK5QX_06255 [bacterium]